MNPWFNSVERLMRLEQVAESWRGTPFMANAAIKGAGVSCQKLVAAVYKECGFLPADFVADDGPMAWSRAQKESLIEKFMAEQTKYFASLDFPRDGRPRAGDMIGIRVEGCLHHSGVVFRADGEFVHVYINQTVFFSNIHDATYWKRIAKIWRPILH
jgi:hypothetical protein